MGHGSDEREKEMGRRKRAQLCEARRGWTSSVTTLYTLYPKGGGWKQPATDLMDPANLHGLRKRKKTKNKNKEIKSEDNDREKGRNTSTRGNNKNIN